MSIGRRISELQGESVQFTNNSTEIALNLEEYGITARWVENMTPLNYRDISSMFVVMREDGRGYGEVSTIWASDSQFGALDAYAYCVYSTDESIVLGSVPALTGLEYRVPCAFCDCVLTEEDEQYVCVDCGRAVCACCASSDDAGHVRCVDCCEAHEVTSCRGCGCRILLSDAREADGLCVTCASAAPAAIHDSGAYTLLNTVTVGVNGRYFDVLLKDFETFKRVAESAKAFYTQIHYNRDQVGSIALTPDRFAGVFGIVPTPSLTCAGCGAELDESTAVDVNGSNHCKACATSWKLTGVGSNDFRMVAADGQSAPVALNIDVCQCCGHGGPVTAVYVSRELAAKSHADKRHLDRLVWVCATCWAGGQIVDRDKYGWSALTSFGRSMLSVTINCQLDKIKQAKWALKQAEAASKKAAR